MSLKPVKAVVFDLDGTLYLGGQVLPGALLAVQNLETRCPVRFLTNNTSRTPEQYQAKLNDMGFAVKTEQILSPLLAVIAHLQKQPRLQQVWALGNAEVLAWLESQAPDVVWNASLPQTDLVLLTYHDSLNYKDLCEVTWRLQRSEVAYWATHPDKVCPALPGSIPDVGSFIELLASATGRRPERVLGKPEPYLLEQVARNLNCAMSDILYVGDRLYTDYELALRSGCQFALTLTGETVRADLEAMSQPPAVVVEHLGELGRFFTFA